MKLPYLPAKKRGIFSSRMTPYIFVVRMEFCYKMFFFIKKKKKKKKKENLYPSYKTNLESFGSFGWENLRIINEEIRYCRSH